MYPQLHWFLITTVTIAITVAGEHHPVEDIYDRAYRLQVEEDSDDNGNEDGFYPKMPYNGKDASQQVADSVYLGVDAESNCMCREYTNIKYATCYDPDKCVKFPRKVLFKYPTLRLSTTGIRVLRYGDLAFKNQHLEVFKMDGNEHFEEIEPGAFINMTNIRNISIYQNPRLNYLHKDSFMGLDNLTMLAVIQNGFAKFYDFTRALSPLRLPRLYKLRLAMMMIENATREDFEIMSGSDLYVLTMVTCHLKYIDPEIIDMFKSLKVLRIGENLLNDDNLKDLLNHIVALNSTIKSLSLTGSSFREIPVEYLRIIANTQISHLTMSSNAFEIIQKFPPMDKIEYLDLKNSLVMNIPSDSFADLPNLKTLILNQNRFSQIPDAVTLPQLKNLDLSDNTQNARYYFYLTENLFVNMHQLTHLNLSLNNIRKVAKQSFIGLTNLTVLDLENTKIYAVEDNIFAPLVNLEYLDLRRNIFPSRMMRPAIYNGLRKLRVLILGQCDIENIRPEDNIFVNMPNLRYLILDGNKLDYLSPFIFRPLKLLKYLDVSSNPLKNWEHRIFPPLYSLRTFISQYTLIRSFNEAMVEDFNSLEMLNLHKNEFSCTCELFGNVPKIMSHQLRKLLEITKPLCSFPDRYLNTTLIDYMIILNTTDICKKKSLLDESTILLIVPISILMVCFILAAVLIYIYRWHIRYWVFLTKLAVGGSSTLLNPRFQTKKTYRYDAFVSYSNEDRNFVVRLVAMLENYEPHLKLCVYERDFQIGTVISDTVLESVGDSRRTLLVISDSYIKSQWCRWEVQVAENHRLFFEDENGKCVNDSLVMIKLGDVCTSNISPMLRYLMKTRIYLQWEQDSDKQKTFWKKLRKALSPPSKLVPVK